MEEKNSNLPIEQDEPVPEKKQSLSEALAQPISFGMAAAMAIGISVLVAITLISVWAKYIKKDIQFGSVDIGAVINLKQLQVSSIAFRPGASNDEVAATYKMIETFGQELEVGLTKVRDVCQCVLLVRNAVVTGGMPDYTDLLKQAVGVEKVDPEMISKMVKSAGSAFNEQPTAPGARK